MKNIFKWKCLVGFTLVLLCSCTKDFVKINTNPNSPTSVPGSNVLGQGIISLTNILFQTHMDLYYTGSYSGMSASDGTGDYEYRVDINNGWWTGLYASMNDFVDADSIASKAGNTNLQAVALTMKAYTAEATTDMFGDIPYSEAFVGTSKGIIYPHYDKQKDVYNAIIAELQTASLLFSKNVGTIGAGDFIFHGDVSKWQKFCNSIILRAAIRISNVDAATAKTIIAGLLGSPSNNPIMTNNADNAYLIYPGSAPDQDLWYEDPGVGNQAFGSYRLNDVLVSTLKNTNDPRLPFYALPNKYGNYNGYRFGPTQLSDT
ncbi:MAG: SusD/RagB family nutrient-binding outer membrane lipoprotein, partial [Bacteroidota bacterium]|nr:SusD/RagB family nutrient-binding outer membrane lipoprotein [Bacteroidota bacterium]